MKRYSELRLGVDKGLKLVFPIRKTMPKPYSTDLRIKVMKLVG